MNGVTPHQHQPDDAPTKNNTNDSGWLSRDEENEGSGELMEEDPDPVIQLTHMMQRTNSEPNRPLPTVVENRALRYASTGHVAFMPPKPTSGLGGRSKSTQTRLKRQGFEPMRRESSVNFVVKSIRRGTEDWMNLIKPFVADLAFRSLVKPRYFSVPRFQAYECHAAVLFVDLSGYSKITAALAEKGAHAISNEVNAYLSQLLQIVQSYGGDVVKFAGDAVLVVWESEEEDLLPMNVLAAAACVLELQERAGRHPIQGTDLSFRIHCGLACGILTSEVFQAKHTENMQRLYHSVGGDPVDEIGQLVDLAAAGEVCVSRDCLDYIEEFGECHDVKDFDADARILVRLNLDSDALDNLDDHIVKLLSSRLSIRNNNIEEDFIHPSVLKLLSHGGLSPTQIAQMRNLCVLFIAMVANGSSVNWLTEVEAILDRHRCPIVQIIDDDKGVHLVGAINLYEANPEAAILGLQICEELQERQVGAAIGMAMGSTFCGVTGSSSIACRWDITGPPAVRAARLMQYAIKEGHEFVLDHSVYQDRMACSRLELLHNGVKIKGTEELCPIYTLSKNKKSAALRILETVHGAVHDNEVRAIQDMLTRGYRSKRTIVITGPPQSGKKTAAQRAAGYADLTPFMHVSSESAGQLQLARTIATWYTYVDDLDIKSGASDVFEHLDARRWSRAHDACIELLNLAVALGLRACFVVDRVHFLDEFSCSLIRESLQTRRAKHGRELNRHWSGRASALSESSENEGLNDANGVVCFLCVHLSLYQHPSARDMANRLSRSGSRAKVPVVTLGRVTTEHLRMLMRDIADMEVDDRWLETYAQASGYCAGYFVERAAASKFISSLRWSQGRKGLAITNQDMALQIPCGMLKKNRDITVHQASADVAMKYTQLFDELPPLFQTFLKVLTMATKGGFFPVPRTSMWEVLNDLIAEGVDKEVFDVVVEETSDMSFITFAPGCTGEMAISLVNPAIADIAYDVCTPEQIDTICMALLDRLEAMVDTQPIVPFVMATFHHRLGKNVHAMMHLWRKGYAMLMDMRQYASKSEFNMLLELIDEEIRECGLETCEVLGESFSYPKIEDKSIGTTLPLCKMYTGPIALGPMGQSVTILSRNIFHEMKVFRDIKPSVKRRLLDSSASASARYCKEAQVIEDFLAEYGLGVSGADVEQEFELVRDIGRASTAPDKLQKKGARMLGELIPKYIESRRERILQMYEKLKKEQSMPWPLKHADPTLRNAFRALLQGHCSMDSVHDALMVLAVNHWKPKRVTELLPLIHYQTVARLRDKVLRRLTEAELSIFRHQQGPEDLGAFLVITALLHKAGQKEKWYL